MDLKSKEEKAPGLKVSTITWTSVTQDAQGKWRESTDITVPLSGADLAALGKTLGPASFKNVVQWLHKSMSVVDSESLNIQEWLGLVKTCTTPEILAAMSRDSGFGGDSILQSILDLGVNIGRKVFKRKFGASSQAPRELVGDYVI